jgi:ferredoxin, 2Fe-2S
VAGIVTVSIRPSGLELEVEAGETVFAAARRNGHRWPTVCQGEGTCRACVMTVEHGVEHCSPIGALELEGLISLREPVDGSIRLACQVRVDQAVVVHKPGVRRVS